MGGLTAGREGEGHDVIAHISSHTVWLRARGGCLCLSPSVWLSVESQGVCWLCDVTCTLAQSPSAANAAD